MADQVLEATKPTVEALTKALLTGESEVITLREVRDLLGKLDATIKSDMPNEARASTCMLLIRRVIDHSVRVAPLAFLKDPLARTLGKTHEALKAFIRVGPQDMPKARAVRQLRPDYPKGCQARLVTCLRRASSCLAAVP